MKYFLFTTLLFFTLLSCGNSESTNNDSSEDQSEPSSESVTYNSPCELFGSEEVREAFSIPEDIELKQEDKARTYPTCSYEWEDGKVTRTQTIGSQEITYDMPSELMIVMVKNANPSMYERSVQVYKDGKDIDGVGEMAMWGEKMSQLSFLSNGYLFHVHVSASNDDGANLEQAKSIAGKIIAKL